MKKIFSLLTISFFLISVQISFAVEVIITSLQGSVEVQKKGEKEWKKVKGGSILQSGDKIRTGKKSQAAAITKEGHKLVIRQNTTFLISKLGPVEWDFQQELGKVRLKVAKLAQGQSLKVKTPTAVCAVRGTEFDVTVLENKSTVLEVWSGQVGFADIAGIEPEIFVLENQRSIVEEGTAPKAPEVIPEQERQKGEEIEGKAPGKESKEEKTEVKSPEKRAQWAAEQALKQELKNVIAREVSFDLNRESIESAAVFEQQSAQYEEAKTLIDAFGQRVRVEEYITRPTPESFKFISLNTRANRFDSGFFEVVANKPLPANLSDAGNLWFSESATKPEFYAVKQRWFVTNTIDSVDKMALDGDSKEITFQEPQFADTGAFLDVRNKKGFQTVFDHRYEFINGNKEALDKIWNDPSFRPKDNDGIFVTGMMWHMRPIQVQFLEEIDPITLTPIVKSSFWQDVFVTRTETPGESGKFVVTTYEPDANPYVVPSRVKHAYINFIDTNQNGRLDWGEKFVDLNGNGMWDQSESFFDVVRLGLHGADDAGKGIFDGTGDTVIFSDLNRNGFKDAVSEPPGDLFVVAKNPWAWQTGENFMIDDLGKVLDFRMGQAALGERNFERVWKSSEFKADKIDIVMSPRTFIKSWLLEMQTRGDAPIAR